MTSLTALILSSNPSLAVQHALVEAGSPWPPTHASSLAALSSLTSLQQLELAVVAFSGDDIPAASFSRLARLTSLCIEQTQKRRTGQPPEVVPVLSGAHLGPLTALRKLSLSEIALSLSAAEARAAWGQLQELQLTKSRGTVPAPLDRGFWQAVSELRCLTEVRFLSKVSGLGLMLHDVCAVGAAVADK